MKKIVFIYLLMLVSNIVANDLKIKDIINDLNKTIPPRKNITQIISQVNSDEQIYNQIEKTASLLDTTGNNIFVNKINKYYENYKKIKKGTDSNSFTIFYFISSDMNKSTLSKFSYSIKKLQKYYPNIQAKIYTYGLVGGSFKNMGKWVANLKDNNFTNPNIKIFFHPWAFDYFKLTEVPALALSYCQNNFRFKTCNHKYLVKGDITLTSFFDIVSNENKKYRKFYFKLIEADK